MAWVNLTPRQLCQAALEHVNQLAAELVTVVDNADDREIEVEAFRRRCIRRTSSLPDAHRAAVAAAINVLIDLVNQRWHLRIVGGQIQGDAPVGYETASLEAADHRMESRERLLVRRHEQLREPATRAFVKRLERGSVTAQGRFTIFSLMRDGRELADKLHSARTETATLLQVVDPYIQFVSPGSVCSHTGMLLQDVWRYFRHTWSNPYESVPGRSMLFLVRDRATLNHCVIGIGALSSAAVQLEARDAYIGWQAEELFEEQCRNPSNEFAEWALSTIDRGIAQIWCIDFIQAKLLPAKLPPMVSKSVIDALRAEGTKYRRDHHARGAASEFKSDDAPADLSEEDWEECAKRDLFRSKRALELAALLELRNVVYTAYAGRIGSERLSALLKTSTGRAAFLRLVRTARAMTVGTEIADLSVCGAVPPLTMSY